LALNHHSNKNQTDRSLKNLQTTMKDQEHRRSHQENSPREYSSERPRNDTRHHNSDSRSSFTPRKNSSKLIGQIFGLIYNLALLYLVYDLAKSGSEKLAIWIFALNAGLIIFAVIYTKRSFKHKSHNSYRDGRNRSPRPSRPSQSAAR
jgi:hypothetical protein